MEYEIIANDTEVQIADSFVKENKIGGGHGEEDFTLAQLKEVEKNSLKTFLVEDFLKSKIY